LTVHLYTKNHCAQCSATKIKFYRAGIDYTETNLETDPDALAYVKTLGYQQAPVVVTPDGDSWSGYRPDLIKALAKETDARH
jgi:glutaredoxin-like protein NrdH